MIINRNGTRSDSISHSTINNNNNSNNNLPNVNLKNRKEQSVSNFIIYFI